MSERGTAAEWREFLKRPGALAECESPEWLLEGCPKCGAQKGFNVTSDCWAYCLGCGWGTATSYPFTPAGKLIWDLLPATGTVRRIVERLESLHLPSHTADIALATIIARALEAAAECPHCQDDVTQPPPQWRRSVCPSCQGTGLDPARLTAGLAALDGRHG